MNARIYGMLRRMICPFDRIIGELPENGRVLDIGSGYGTFCLMAAESKGLSILGLELSERRVMAANIRAREQGIGSRVKFSAQDVTRAKFREKFDAVTCIDIFHHIDRKHHRDIIRSAKGALADNGMLIVKDMDTKPFRKYAWNFLHDMAMTRTVRMFYTPKEAFTALLEEEGFKISKIRDLSNPLYAHYIICAVKQ